MLKRLLLALDAGDSGTLACSFTIALARTVRAEVHVVHVQVGAESDAESAAVVAAALREMDAAGVRACGVTYRTTSRDVAAAVCDLADECRADAIVVGSRRRRFAAVVRRGTRDRIVRHSSLPVITAPAPLRVAPALEGAPSLLDLSVRP